VKQLTNDYSSNNFLKGNLGMAIVKAMLEKSGYTVCHYGYEITLLDAKSKRTYKKSSSTTGRRIRSSPDLLVYDDKDIMMLVEVKTRTKSHWMGAEGIWIRSYEVEPLKTFWNDSILAVVVPEGNVFYAQKISELETQQTDHYSLEKFKKFQEIFTKVSPEDISHFMDIASQIFRIFTKEKEKALGKRSPTSLSFRTLELSKEKELALRQ
jgi:hypothetical protein